MSALRGLVTLARVVRTLAESQVRRIMVDVSAHRDDRTPFFQPYGLHSAPLEGATAVQVAVGGDAGSLITILVDDRRYSVTLEAGEVALGDDLGQKVHLTRTGIVVKSSSIKLGDAATLKVARETDPVGVSVLWNTWFNAVATATSTTAAKTAADAVSLGTITTGSTVTRSE